MRVYVQNSVPTVTVTGVSGDGQISWTADDPEDNASLSLYYDIDPSGYDGSLIAVGLALEASPYPWDLSAVPTGDFYIYAKVEDNVNSPQYSYFDSPLHVDNITAPATPTGATARAGLDLVLLSWQAKQ